MQSWQQNRKWDTVTVYFSRGARGTTYKMFTSGQTFLVARQLQLKRDEVPPCTFASLCKIPPLLWNDSWSLRSYFLTFSAELVQENGCESRCTSKDEKIRRSLRLNVPGTRPRPFWKCTVLDRGLHRRGSSNSLTTTLNFGCTRSRSCDTLKPNYRVLPLKCAAFQDQSSSTLVSVRKC